MQQMQEDHRKPKPKLGFVTQPMGQNILFHNEFDQALDDEEYVQTYWHTTTHVVHTPLISYHTLAAWTNRASNLQYPFMHWNLSYHVKSAPRCHI